MGKLNRFLKIILATILFFKPNSSSIFPMAKSVLYLPADLVLDSLGAYGGREARVARRWWGRPALMRNGDGFHV
jgi:hypothetical protein